MKVLYLSWFNSGEGSQVHAKEFMNAMNQLGNHVIPVELSLKTKKQLENLKIQTTSHSSKGKLSFIKELKTFLLNILRIIRLLKLYREHKPDAIINRYLIYDFSAIIAGKLLNIPVMYEVNASAVYEREIENRYYIKPLAKWVEKYIFKKSDIVTVVSNELKNYFEENGYNVSNTIVIPNGVNVEKYQEDIQVPPSFDDISHQWKDKLILGFLGSLKSWHGIQRVIDLMPSLIKKNPNIRLLIVGDGNTRSEIEKKIEDYKLKDHVFISGFIPHEDVPGALHLFDVALAPYNNISNFYFSPLKIFEYMAAGKPVVAPSLGQIKELVQSNYTGLLLDENTDSCLEESILSIIEDSQKLKQMGLNAKNFITEHYTWTKNAETISSALETMVIKKN